MLLDHDFAQLRFELLADLATPRAAFETLMLPRSLLNRRNVLSNLVVAGAIAMMHRKENAKRPRKERIKHRMVSSMVVPFQSVRISAAIKRIRGLDHSTRDGRRDGARAANGICDLIPESEGR